MFVGMLFYAETEYGRAAAYLREALAVTRTFNRAS
jgi:hypothetical protein